MNTSPLVEIQFALRPRLGRQVSTGSWASGILRLAADLVGLGHLLGGLPMETGGNSSATGRGTGSKSFRRRRSQNIETLLKVARLVEIRPPSRLARAAGLLTPMPGGTEEEPAPPAMAMSTRAGPQP